MNMSISKFGDIELLRWMHAFWQQFNVVLLQRRKLYAPNGFNMQTQ